MLALYFAASIVAAIGIDVALKLWAASPCLTHAALVVTGGVASSAAWLGILRCRNELARIGTVWAVLAAVVTVAVGLAFGEHLAPRQWVGVAVALVAVWLLA